MKKLLLITLFFLPIVSFAQQTTFNKVYYESGGTGIESRSVAKTFDGGYLIAGKANYYMGYLLKTDANGVEVWNKFFNPSPTNSLEFNRIISTTDSCFAICGLAQFNSQAQATLIKINSLGDTLWTKTYSRAGEALFIYNIGQALDGGYIMTGYSSFNSAPYSTMLLIKTNAIGDLEWMQTMTANNHQNIGYSVKQDADSNYVVTGLIEEQTGPSSFEIGMCLAKFSPTGTQLFAKKYFAGTNNAVWGYDFEITPSGYMCYLNSNYFDAIIKTDLQGNILSGSRFDLSNTSALNLPMPKIKQTHDGGYVFVAGSCFGPNFLCKIDSMGAYQWSDHLNLNAAEIVEGDNFELFVAGSGPLCGIRASQVLWPQIGIIQTDSLGNIPGSQCTNVSNITPAPLSLSTSNITFTITTGGTQGTFQNILGNYTLINYDGCVDFSGGINELNEAGISVSPNPAFESINIKLSHPIAVQSITIYDVTGKKFKEEPIHNGYANSINTELEELPSGMYIITVETDSGILRQRFVKQ